MELFEAVSQTIRDTKVSLWPGFAAELILCATILVLLVVRMCGLDRFLRPFFLTAVGGLLALYYAFPLQFLVEGKSLPWQELFTGMLVFDTFAVYVRSLLMLFVVLFAIFTWLSGIPNQEDGTDIYCLVLGATLGMCLMATANHLFMVFLAIELASVPSYALAATLKGRRTASEAALKYSIYGAGAAGVMLYGISLLAGMTGSAHLPTIAMRLADLLPGMSGTEKVVLMLAALMIMAGLAFKLSAVPFHFWCPDVFEGASAEINAFLSVASKTAALALVVRIAIGFGTLPVPSGGMEQVAAAGVDATEMAFVSEVREDQQSTDAILSRSATSSLAPVRHFMAMLWTFVAAITCTFGNLAAYGQTNIKRLLAYSTIAHAGYMLMPIPAALAMLGQDPEAANRAIGALAIYMGIYLFMNLAAFAIVAFLRNAIGSEQIADYGGLIKQYPAMVVCTAIVMFSLVGIPPLAGFVGKFAIFASLMEGYHVTGQNYLFGLLVIGGLNTVISLFYYLRVVKVMAIDPESVPRDSGWSMVSLGGAFVIGITAPILILFVYWNGLNAWASTAVSGLF